MAAPSFCSRRGVLIHTLNPPESAPVDFPNLTVVGSLNIDLVARVDHLPGPGETVGGGLLTRRPGGKGANQAVAAARLGGRVSLIGAVGDDDDGREMVLSLQARGVDVSRVRTVPAVSGTALVTVDSRAENCIAVCPGANDYLSVDADEIRHAGAILVQLEIPLPVVETAVTSATGFVAINAAPAIKLGQDVLKRADLIIVNDAEFQEVPEVVSAKNLAVTHGGRGASLYQSGELIADTRAFPAKLQNTVGAGDAFCAALTLALSAHVAPITALRVAAVVGAFAVSSDGAQPPLGAWTSYRDIAEKWDWMGEECC